MSSCLEPVGGQLLQSHRGTDMVRGEAGVHRDGKRLGRAQVSGRNRFPSELAARSPLDQLQRYSGRRFVVVFTSAIKLKFAGEIFLSFFA